MCRLYHALRQPTRLCAAPPASTPLSDKMVEKVRGLKAETPKRVWNRDVTNVTGIMGIMGFCKCVKNELGSTSGQTNIFKRFTCHLQMAHVTSQTGRILTTIFGVHCKVKTGNIIVLKWNLQLSEVWFLCKCKAMDGSQFIIRQIPLVRQKNISALFKIRLGINITKQFQIIPACNKKTQFLFHKNLYFIPQ